MRLELTNSIIHAAMVIFVSSSCYVMIPQLNKRLVEAINRDNIAMKPKNIGILHVGKIPTGIG